MEVTIRLPKLHSAQQQIKNEARRFNVLNCGRRFGKDVLGQELLLDPALEGAPVAWFAPTYRMMLDNFRDISDTVRPIASKVNASEHRIELVTKGVIDFWSLDTPDAARGRKYKRVIINEAAMIAGLLRAWNLVIRPTLADYRGEAFFLSTPKGLNDFKTLYDLAQTDPNWHSWQFPTAANPHIRSDEIEAMRRGMPERVFLQEILAQFIDDGGMVFRFVRDAATGEPQEPQTNAQYVIGVDWGRSNDATVFTVLDVQAARMVYLDRMTDTDYNLQRARLKALAQRYNDALVIAEANSMGTPQIEALQAMGVYVQAFQTTNATKMQIIDALALAFEQREITILNDATLINELEVYESERLPSGAIRYSAPDGMHDDCVMSLALAYHGINSGVGVLFEV